MNAASVRIVAAVPVPLSLDFRGISVDRRGGSLEGGSRGVLTNFGVVGLEGRSL